MSQNPVATPKIRPPGVTAILPRPRLFELLDELRHFPVLWIGGSPGDGKTALVASYIEDRRLPAIWYHADREDTDGEALIHLSGAEMNAKARGAVRSQIPSTRQPPPGKPANAPPSGRRL